MFEEVRRKSGGAVQEIDVTVPEGMISGDVAQL